MLEFLSQKDKERIKEMKQATDLKAAQAKARSLAQSAASSRAQVSTPALGNSAWHLALGVGTAASRASNFKPFAKDPEKQRRYEEFLVHMKKGQKGGCRPGGDAASLCSGKLKHPGSQYPCGSSHPHFREIHQTNVLAGKTFTYIEQT